MRLLPGSNLWTVHWRNGQLKCASCQNCHREAEAADDRRSRRILGREHAQGCERDGAIGVGIKVSAAWTADDGGTWPDSNVHTYTYGHRRSSEVQLARQLALALGMKHTFVPVEGDFFTSCSLRLPLGVTEMFHKRRCRRSARRRDGRARRIAGGGWSAGNG